MEKNKFRTVFLLFSTIAILWPSLIPATNFSINIPADSSRVYAFTNRLDSFWAGETNDYHTSAFHGLTYRKQAIFEDFYIFVDGQLLDRSQSGVTVHPTHLERQYKNPAVIENLYFPDNQHTLVVEIIPEESHQFRIVPGFAGSRINFEIITGGVKIVQPDFATDAGLPVTTYISVNQSGQWYEANAENSGNLPGVVSSETPVEWSRACGDTLRITLSFAADAEKHRWQQHHWEDGLGRRAGIAQNMRDHRVTDNLRVNKALFWARLSMDALIMNQSGKGIYAGLPWFDDYWGRDTFISLPGAVLVNGNYDAAKAILRSFAEFQITDSTEVNYGRIPNRVTPGEKIYNTTDGTPWFIWMIYEYLRYSGDFVFAQEMFPVIQRSIAGAQKYHVDESGFLAHANAETWMDAVGPDGPWSPRGNRAVEIQVLWYKQLQAGIAIADMLGNTERQQQWETMANTLKKNFRAQYWNVSRQDLYDHLNINDIPDSARRPNQMFAVSLSDDLLSSERQGKVVKSVLNSVVYPWGVASLAQTDPKFHPYHQAGRFYPKDAAYHNGIVWTWLSGPVITGLTKYGMVDSAYVLTQDLTEKILDRGMAGSMCEVTDALPRSFLANDPNPNQSIDLSGTFSQAWSLAEYLRNWSQDYFGIHPDAFENQLTLAPQLPNNINQVRTEVTVGKSTVDVAYHRTDDVFSFALRNTGNPVSVNLQIRREEYVFSLKTPFQLAETKAPVKIKLDYNAGTFFLEDMPLKTNVSTSKFRAKYADKFQFVEPYLNPELPALQGPNHPVISGTQATQKNPDARTILDIKDPAGDDFGPQQQYQYPTDPAFEPGIFDLRGFQLQNDDDYTYWTLPFENLVQPGWHPEYGFQLTYAAIGIHTGSDAGIRTIGANAQYSVDNNTEPMDYILYIGGGFRLEDTKGNIVMEYIPLETGYPMANLATNQIQISIPKQYLPQPKKWWKYTIITGAQDDHGGAGLGEFRTVKKKAAPWNGGGKIDPQAPNWYDVLEIGY